MTTKTMRLLLATLVLFVGGVAASPADAETTNSETQSDPAALDSAAEGGSGEGEAFLSEDGYLWHSNPTAASTVYAGDGSTFYSYHPQGDDYTVTRTALGRYTVDYPSLGGSYPIPTVTKYGAAEEENCSLWFFSPTQTQVRCYDSAGAAADSRFALRLTSTDEDAVTWVRANASGLIGDRNPWGADITVAKPGVGHYTVTTPGGPNFEGGHIQVTAYAGGGTHCKSGGWSGTTATVYCHNAAGNRVDAAFTFLRNGSEDDAYAWANNPTSTVAYTTSPFWSHNPQGNNPTSIKTATGVYRVTFPSLLVAYGGMVNVTSYGSDADKCNISSWSNTAASVRCSNSAGNPVDSQFNVLFTRFRLCNGLPANVEIGNNLPTNGSDVIIGTNNNDVINALGGNDTVCALAGDDNVIGAAGNDVIFGGPGNDTISGNAGNDRAFGEDGNDIVFTGSGNDIVEGGDGNDVLGTSSGIDSISGGNGNDVISGGSDNDSTVDGGNGDDAVNGGGGDDNDVRGGFGNDTVSGNGGDDRISGGPGQDEVRGGPGDDLVLGGDDNDFLSGNAGIDTCDGQAGIDVANTNNCETILNVP